VTFALCRFMALRNAAVGLGVLAITRKNFRVSFLLNLTSFIGLACSVLTPSK